MRQYIRHTLRYLKLIRAVSISLIAAVLSRKRSQVLVRRSEDGKLGSGELFILI